VLRGVRALDAGGDFSGPLDVVVSDGTIVSVGPRGRALDGVAELDGAGLWLMPGVFDCHLHVGMSSIDTLENLKTPLSLRALQTARNLERTLAAGVTHVRDAGGADAGVRLALERGLIEGPALEVSIVMLSQTGGHADGFLAGGGISISVEDLMPPAPGRPPFIVDGPEQMCRVVREVLRAGADWIKVCTTGGVFSGAGAANESQLSVGEVAVAVVEAARRGRGVMAHAVGSAGIDVALEAGVRSIEHGVHLTEAQAVRMAASGVFLVPTLVIYRWALEMIEADPDRFSAEVRAGAAEIGATLGTCVALAHEHGVPIALGSDFATAGDHGGNLAEITWLHLAGLPVEEALLAATLRGAELCGVADRQGRIAPGYVFDAVLLDEDPGDLSCFLRDDAVSGVFRAGSPVVPHARLEDARGDRRT
jgi:imidazolonepropionase-like amidohydrolase